MRRAIRIATVIIFVFGQGACGEATPPAQLDAVNVSHSDAADAGVDLPVYRVTGQPEQPALKRESAPVRQDGESAKWMAPLLPPLRTSADGRVGLYMKGVAARAGLANPLLPAGARGGIAFSMIRPEQLTGSLLLQPAGTVPISEPRPEHTISDLDLLSLSPPSGSGTFQHATICDPSAEHAPNGQANPYACDQQGVANVGGTYDCYDLTIIAPFEYDDRDAISIAGIPVRLRVSQPKSAQSEIAEVTVHADNVQWSNDIEGPREFLEPMVTSDGRMIVARTARSVLQWNDAGGTPQSGIADIVYAVAPETAAPCDVSQWHQLYPISHAAYDTVNDMPNRYGIASFPMRDPTGKLIPDGADIKATYPWIDRKGANLFATTISATLFYEQGCNLNSVTTRYPASCAVAGCSDPGSASERESSYDEASPATRGVAVVGRWTHGKIVLLDGPLNHTDYGTNLDDNAQRLVHLYQPTSGNESYPEGKIRIGGGRVNDSTGRFFGSVGNLTFIDSPENIFNYTNTLKPLTRRDVVWLVSTGRNTAEVIFDDYLDPRMVVFSEMSGALSWERAADEIMVYYDGFALDPSCTAGQGIRRNAFIRGPGPVRVQNAATATAANFDIPAYGAVAGARLEPVAAGGVHGKGLWLEQESSVRYQISARTASYLQQHAAYLGLFIDPRFDDSGMRRLLTLGSTLSVDFVGRQKLRFTAGGQQFHIDLPALTATAEFVHVGFAVRDGGTSLEIYINGFLAHSQSLGAALTFDTINGFDLVIGSPSEATIGVRGWIDELKLIARAPSPELACNHARGSLARVTGGSWLATANSFPALGHQRISQRLGAPNQTRFACVHNYQKAFGVEHELAQSGVASVRDALLFPEGPLKFGAVRPDSSQNGFCKTCHSSEGKGGLDLEALVQGSVAMELDARRQPLQPAAKTFGHVPAGMVFNQLPTAPEVAPLEGLWLDAWVYP